jgi:hypothetical protein
VLGFSGFGKPGRRLRHSESKLKVSRAGKREKDWKGVGREGGRAGTEKGNRLGRQIDI